MANRYVFLLLLSAFLWSLGGVLIKIIDWTPLGIAGVRCLLGGLLMMVCCRSAWRNLSWAAIPGAIAYSATVLLFVVATKLTTAANAIFLQYTAPIYIAIIGPWYLREKTNRRDWIFVLIAVAGVALFFLDQLSFSGFYGVLAALASGFSFAWMTILLRRQRQASPESVILLGNILSALIALPWCLDLSAILRNAPGLVALGVVQLSVPYLIYARAIRHVRALDAALISTIEPILNPLWVMLAVSEKPAPWALVGGTIVLVSAFLRSFLAARGEPGVSPLPAVPEAIGPSPE
jgi:drug/metabolite transporter (DMT)-like permease